MGIHAMVWPRCNRNLVHNARIGALLAGTEARLQLDDTLFPWNI